ncbi:Palmitoyltransferase zdhhc15 [Phytophthora pseudosyringae]|uniref:Palmitoyltransferase n=1 Tax=Phytophthora pseudosyringae TaxID=221518 RepID=A0A8T1W479_9STRA|nr:Palmitoyltransferase zdhhc15 [Phytophthora pseudosyringae]
MSRGFVAVALGLMLLKLYTWVAIVRAHSSVVLNALYFVFTVLMFWSYARAMYCRPASSKPVNDTERVSRYCERCDADKADHVHHCSVCQRCVYRMDHHCPWTGNCVAWSNKKFFLLFLAYTSLSCLAFNAMTSPLVWDARFRRYESLLKFGWAMTLGVGLLLAGYFVFHMWLLREGKTTLEFLAGKRGELADCSFRHNVRVYFGSDVWSWWLPTTPTLDAAMGGRAERDDDDGEETLQLVVE